MVHDTAGSRFIRWFDEIGIEDIPLVGGKNASLGEMYRELTPGGVKVPDGFAVTAEAYRHFLREAGLDRQTPRDPGGAGHPRPRRPGPARPAGPTGDPRRPACPRTSAGRSSRPTRGSAERRARPARRRRPEQRHRRGPARRQLRRPAGDVPQRPGRRGAAGRLPALLRLALHRPGHLLPRRQGLRPLRGRPLGRRPADGPRPTWRASGVMFTLDTETGFRDVVLINAAYGLGENVVQGSVEPGRVLRLQADAQAGLPADPPEDARDARSSSWSTTSAAAGWRRTSPCRPRTAAGFASTDDEILTAGPLGLPDRGPLLAPSAAARRRWTSSGPRTAAPASCSSSRPGPRRSSRRAARGDVEVYRLKKRGPVLVTGRSVGEKIGAGPVRVVKSVARPRPSSSDGEVLVTDKTDPDWEPMMKKAAAIVTNRGGRTCHAAIVSRELGVPGVVGTERGTERAARRPGGHRLLRRGRRRLRLRGPLPFDVARRSTCATCRGRGRRS